MNRGESGDRPVRSPMRHARRRSASQTRRSCRRLRRGARRDATPRTGGFCARAQNPPSVADAVMWTSRDDGLALANGSRPAIASVWCSVRLLTASPRRPPALRPPTLDSLSAPRVPSGSSRESDTRWRIHHAGRLLHAPGATVASVAPLVGYASEAAFSRAFKRHMGTAPAALRRRGSRNSLD
jgi:hypothetical protein